MRLPFFRNKAPAGEPAKPPRRAAAAAAAAAADDGPVQAARVQARRRLIGALVLLAIGVVGFPVLFETTPRPLPVNTPILVPEGTPARAVTGSVPAPAARPTPTLPPPDAGNEVPVVAAAAPASAASPTAPSAAPPQPAAPVKLAVMTPTPGGDSASSPGVLTPPKRTAPRADPPVAASAAPQVSTPARMASSPALAATGRFVVQVGAYNDVERLKAARQKLEKMGLKTFTQDVETPSGKRTRLRVGPWSNRAEAEAAAAKLKAAGMQANILAL